MIDWDEVMDVARAGFARMDEQFDRLERLFDETRGRFRACETAMAGLKRDVADLHLGLVGLSHRLYRLDASLDRIERRLNLVDA